MTIIADLHIHSKYSRATSSKMDLAHIDYWARLKGINVVATGDFTHPAWLKEIKEKLTPAEDGLFKLKKEYQLDKAKKLGADDPRFMLEAEISSIYKKNGKVRKIHNNIYAPSIEAVENLNARLNIIGNLKADGRPILGLDAKKLLEITLDTCPGCFLVPSHAWTPWFSLFGSKSGFDSIEECFEDLSDQIFAIETGLSSDPAMNWRLSALDNISLISNSDAHSPRKLGREVNIFDAELSYPAIKKAIKQKSQKAFKKTIEFFPQEGKYHYDGHRKCNVCFSPQETKKHKGICPQCGQPLTVGVMNRVVKLSDRPEGRKPANTIPFQHLIPLEEVIADALDFGPKTKTVTHQYLNLTSHLGPEFEVLLEAPVNEIKAISSAQIAEAVKRVRQQKVHIKPGYDGKYGEIKIFEKEEREKAKPQQKLL